MKQNRGDEISHLLCCNIGCQQFIITMTALRSSYHILQWGHEQFASDCTHVRPGRTLLEYYHGVR